MRTLACLGLLVLGCGSSGGGSDMSMMSSDLSASSGDMTFCNSAGGPLSRCGKPCDTGNSLGVGQYCTNANNPCGSNSMAKICSALLNAGTPSADDTYFCTFQCDSSKP